MLYRVDTIIPPTLNLVTLAQQTQYARVNDDFDNPIIQGFALMVVEQAQKFLNRAIGTQTIQLTLAHHKPTGNYGNGGWSYGGWNSYRSIYNQHSIELPYGPVQQVVSVARGYWDETPDDFLTEGVDYFVDTESLPARIRLITPVLNFFPGVSHLSVQYVAGWDATNIIQAAGTASEAGTLGLTVAGVSVPVAIATGDTALDASTAIQAAIAASAASCAATVLSPSMVQLRGGNPTASVTATVPGLTVTAGTPVSEIPASISQAILLATKWMYDGSVAATYSDSGITVAVDHYTDFPPFFYRMLQQYKQYTFE